MRKKLNKLFSIFLSVIMAISGAMPSVATAPAVYAETMENPARTFYLYDDRTAAEINPGSNYVLQIYTDDSRDTMITGETTTRSDAIKFTPSGTVDSEKKYYYGIKVEGYDWCYGGPFTFGESDFYVLLHRTAPDYVRMINNNNGKDFASNEVSFSIGGSSIGVPFTEKGYDFNAYKAGDVIEYKITKDGYLTTSGSFTLVNGDQKVRVDITKKSDLGINYASINKVYGDEDFAISDYITHTEGYDGSFTYTLKSGSDVVSLKEDGTVSIIGVGSAVVNISGSNTDTFNGTSGDVRIYVDKKALGTITSDKIKWENTEKIYDGETKFDITGKLSVGQSEADDEITVSATAILDGTDVGNHTTTLTKISVSGADNFTYTLDQISGPVITITPKEVTLKLNNISVAYASDEWKNICDGELPAGTSMKEVISFVSEVTTADKEAIMNMDLSEFLKAYVIAGKYRVGTSNDALVLTVKNPLAGNYKLIAAEDANADVTVTEQRAANEDIWSLLEADESSEHISTRDGVIYVRPGGKLVLKLKNTLVYDTVNAMETYPEAAENYSNVLYAPETASSGNITAKFYLSVAGDEKTRTYDSIGNDNQIPVGAVKIDADYPEVTFTDGTGKYAQAAKGGDPTFNTLTFDRIVRAEGYTLTVAASDKDSGVKDTAYTIVSIKSKKDAEQAVLNAVNTDQTEWNALPEDGKVKVDGTKTGYYIVLIKTSDKVGNEAVYASNGIVIDTTNPVLTVSGIDNSTVYGEDITYNVAVGDPEDINGVKTGIEKVIVTVEKDGKVVEGKKFVDSFELSAADVYNLTAEEPTFDGFTISSADKSFNSKITAANNNSNNIVLTVKVIDKAGNEIVVTKHLMIDTTAPSVDVSYDKNDPKNGTYFNKDRNMTVVFTERNFDEEKTSFNLKVDDVQGKYTIAQIRNGKADGVYIVKDRVDSEKDVENTFHTDKRTNTYVIGFGGNGKKVDHDYEITVGYVDAAGNEAKTSYGESVAANKFTVDEIAPVFSAMFANNKGATVPVGTDKDTPYYDQDHMTVTLSVEERNFRNSDVSLTLEAKDAAGNDVAAYSVNSLEKPSTNAWKTTGSTNTFVMDVFDQDANYAIAGTYTDLAGNEAEPYDMHYFTIDGTAPTGTIYVEQNGEKIPYSKAVEDQGEGGILNFIFKLFFANKVNVETDALDATSGLKSLKYHLVRVDRKAGEVFSTDADFENMTWTDWEEGKSIEIKGAKDVDDEIALIYARIEDNAGHVSYISSDGGIIVDTMDPDKPVITVEDSAKIHNGDFSVKVSAEDPDNGGEGVYAGMKSICYQLIDENAENTSELFEAASTTAARVKKLNGNAKIVAKDFNSNNVSLKIIATDFAGNETVETTSYMIDVTNPSVSIEMDSSDAKNGHYYNTAKQLKVSVQERNFDAGTTYLNLTIDGKNETFSFADIVSGNAEKYGISAKEVSDTQSDRKTGKKTLTDDRIVTYEFTLGTEYDADHEYKNISVTAKDAAGNTATAGFEKIVTIDKVAPVITVDYNSHGDVSSYVTTNAASPYFSNQDITVKINVTEKNFSSEGLTLSLTQTNGSGKEVGAYSPDNLKASALKWSKDGQVNTGSMATFSKDAIYGLKADYTDLAGNKAKTYSRHYFCVDKTAPSGSLTVTSSDGKKTYTGLSGTAQFEFISKSPVAVVEKASDETAGIARVEYYKYTPGTNVSGTFKVPTKEDLKDVKWTEWTKDLSISPDSQAVIYAKITDKAGNVIYINTEGAIIADKTAPVAPAITINAKADSGVFGNSVPVSVSVKDKVAGGTYAGLKNVTVQVLKDGTVTQTSKWDAKSKSGRQLSYDTKLTVDASKNNSNEVIVRVTAVDYAGNQSSSEQKIAIDVTAPKIEVTYDNNSPANGKYYNAVRTATVRVYERNFDPSKVSFTFAGGTKPSVSAWTIGKSAGSSDSNVNSCTITYSTDADYTFTMSVTDKAGNKTDYGKTDSFTIDRTKPVISVSFDNNSTSGKYFKKTRTATITIKEHNFNAKDFAAAITAKVNGKDVNAPSVSGWSSNGDTHTATIKFAADADYSFVLNYTDLAGNKADTYTQEKFTIDANAPEIEFFDVKENSANNGTIAPGVKFTDVNYSKENIVLTLKGLKHKETRVTGTYSPINGGGQIKLADFKHEATVDDIYTLTAKFTDLAGNATEKSITFSVNRFGSNYTFESDTESYIDGYYHNEAEDLVIYEVNVDSLNNKGITVLHDGTAMNLTSDQYKVEDVTKDNDWKKYKYTIDASLFEKEGLYEVMINSVDAAGNRQDNKLKEAPISFVIDKTAPSAIITGIEDKEMYDGSTRSITIKVSDDQAVGTMKLFINDKEVGSYTAEDIEALEGKIVYELKESNGWQTISVKVTDAAGNEGKTESAKVLLTTSSLLRILNSTVFRVTAIAVIALAVLIFFLIGKRKKKRENENA